ncbi:hypothetical protein BDZ97DRAFT_1794917, partial [Flammula alnicola]
LEYEKELITKLLRKLVKENFLLEMKGDAQESMLSSSAAVEGKNVRVYYMVHPSVDTILESLRTATRVLAQTGGCTTNVNAKLDSTTGSL